MNELDQYFTYKCQKGLEERGLANLPEYQKRLQFELDTVNRMGFSGYFLIVQDFINWAKANNIYVGPGRGSAAGALVSYCLRITNLDPIRWDLLFERFLNPDRMGSPDYEAVLPKVSDNTSLTTDELLDILESGGLEDVRLKNIKGVPSLS